MTICQQAGDGIHGLLDSVFSFLQRRTDFYYEAEPGDKMGFPPKFAEGLVSQDSIFILDRSINSIKSTKMSMRKSSLLKVKHWQSDGTNSKKIKKKQSLKLQLHQKLKVFRLSRSRRQKTNQSLLKFNQQHRSSNLQSATTFQNLLCLRKKLIKRLALTTEVRLISTTGANPLRMSMFKFHCLRELHRDKYWLRLNQNI